MIKTTHLLLAVAVVLALCNPGLCKKPARFRPAVHPTTTPSFSPMQ